MKTWFKCLITGAFCFFSSLLAASVSQLTTLVEGGQYEEAYQLAQSLLDDYEGNPGFDFQYGVAAVDSGRVGEGVFALERVLMLEPNNYLAKLELARGYYFLGQFAKARALFQQVKQVNPPPAVLIRIEQFLARMESKATEKLTRLSGFAELWAGYDTNINAGPDSQTQVVILSQEALGRGDGYRQMRAGGRLEHDYTDAESIVLSTNVDSRVYDTEYAQDFRSVSMSGSHLWKKESGQYQVNLVGQYYGLGHEKYRSLYGVGGEWSKQLSSTSLLKTFVGINRLYYTGQNWRNSRQSNVGVNYLRAVSGEWKPLYFVGTFIGREKPKVGGILADGQVDRRFYGANIGVQLMPSQKLTLTPSLTYQGSRYRGDDWIYGIRRQDDFLELGVSLTWQLDASWSLLSNYRYTNARSNIELYEYDRQQLMVGLRYNFN